MKYKCYIKSEVWNDRYEIYLTSHQPMESDSCYYYTIKNGQLGQHKRKEGEIIKEPLLKFTGEQGKNILSALVEGLKEAGYVAEVDNAQRITSEAVAKERKEEISWLRTQIEKQL